MCSCHMYHEWGQGHFIGTRAFYNSRLQIYNQISKIDNYLFVIGCTLSNGLIKIFRKLTYQGNSKNSKISLKVTANILNFIYSEIRIDVLIPN